MEKMGSAGRQECHRRSPFLVQNRHVILITGLNNNERSLHRDSKNCFKIIPNFFHSPEKRVPYPLPTYYHLAPPPPPQAAVKAPCARDGSLLANPYSPVKRSGRTSVGRTAKQAGMSGPGKPGEGVHAQAFFPRWVGQRFTVFFLVV